MGIEKCCYLEEGLYLALELAARLTYEKFPDRLDRTLFLGDACPYHGNCPGHPRTSHEGNMFSNTNIGWRTIDINYYTLVGYDKSKNLWGNLTQYHPKGHGTTALWWKTHEYDNDKMELMPNVYDGERMAFFFLTLKTILGSDYNIHFGNHTLLKKIDKIFCSYKEYIRLNTVTNDIGGTTYNHHTHVHLVLRGKGFLSCYNLFK